MADDKVIYKGLECHCNKIEKIPINRRDLGFYGEVATYGIAISEAYATYSLNKYLKKEGVDILGRRTAKMLIKMNAGILSVIQGNIEGKSAKRITFETSSGVIIGKIAEQAIDSKNLTKVSNFASSSATRLASSRVASNIAVKTGVSLLTRIGTGAAAGAAIGSSFPIAGTIIGAVAGALIAGMINDAIFADEDEQLEKDKAHNAEIERLEKAYNLKINRINDYLVRNKYIELRILDDIESEILCKEASNLKSSYFKTILLMQSFPNYLDRDKEFYDTLQQKELDTSKDSKERNSKEKDKAQSKEPKITPIANAIPLTIEIEKCYDGASGNLLKNTTIYLYNHRFKRVVAKGQSDERGKLIVHNVYVGKENTIDKVSFVVDRENFDENNFELSVLQYAPMFNVQKKYKEAKKALIEVRYFSFNTIQGKLEFDYEVSNLKVNIHNDTLELIPTHNLKDTRLRHYMRCAYMVFDITDDNIDKHISNITIENRAVSGLNNLGYSQIGKYKIKKEWRDKIVVFFAYFDKQEKTPYFKVSFITKPILIIDAGNSGAIPLQYEREYKRIDIIFDIIQGLKRMITANVYLVQLQENAKINMSLEQRTQIANTIKHNTQSKRILFLSLHIDSESSEQISGMRCFYNDKAYKKEEERFIERLKQVNQNCYFLI